MKDIVLKTTACLALFALTINVNAQDTKKGKFTERFNNLDINNDGFLDKEEAKDFKKGQLVKHFDKVDANKDSLLSKEEIKAYRVKRKAAREALKAKKAAGEK
jgi:Ca2+-binding EF-hand superfamily protein